MTEHTSWEIDWHIFRNNKGKDIGRIAKSVGPISPDHQHWVGPCLSCSPEDAILASRAPELLAENEELKARIAELQAEQTWQPIETAPRNRTKVLLYHPKGGVVSGFFDSRWRRSGKITDEMPTHFMPLPKMGDE